MNAKQAKALRRLGIATKAQKRYWHTIPQDVRNHIRTVSESVTKSPVIIDDITDTITDDSGDNDVTTAEGSV